MNCKKTLRGAWLAQLEKCASLDLGVVNLPHLGYGDYVIKKKKQPKTEYISVVIILIKEL